MMTKKLDARVAGAMGVARGWPHYSTDIAAAWQVVEWMTARGWEANLECLPVEPSPVWFVRFNYYRDGQANRPRGYAEGADFAGTVCRAFLLAMRDERIRSNRPTVPAPPPAPPPLVIRKGK